MKITPDTIVGEVVKMNFKTASLFQASNIDYCCGGRITISEACAGVGIDSNMLITNLDAMLSQTDPDASYINSLNLAELTSYIVKRHHTYVRESIPFIEKSLEKLCQVHGNKHPELFKISELFNNSAGELTKHMQKEEIVLFPYINKLVLAQENGTQPSEPRFGTVSNPIGAMMAEHQAEGERFDEISKLSNNYQVPGDACITYKVTFDRLNDYENDLHRHIHIENNILFPRAILLEKDLLS
jgi:iron-sulfur cluster repair di-iron protein